jgi:AcrR family transcriptional regulator
MLKPVSKSPEERAPLSRERVLRGAVAIADASGIRAVTIRSLARELGVKPMSLYHYVAGKDEILDGIGRRRLAVGDAPASDLGPSRAEAPPLGDRPPWSREPPRAPRRCDTATRPSAPCAEPASRWQ